MNNTIAYIVTTFLTVTVIVDIGAFTLRSINNRAYEQNGNKPRKGTMYWAYLVVSRLALFMTFVAAVTILCFIGIALADLMSRHKNVSIYSIAACVCAAIAWWTWCTVKAVIEKEQTYYDMYPDNDSSETFIDTKDKIAVNQISFWLIINIIMSGCIVAFAILITYAWG